MKKPNPKDARGASKPPLWLVPPAAIVMAAWAYRGGADKYGAFNYRENDIKASVYISSVLRHVFAYALGEDVDADPSAKGALHLGEAIAGLGILCDATAHGNLVDDRAKSPKMAKLLRALFAEFEAGISEKSSRKNRRKK